MKRSLFKLEREFVSRGYEIVIGIDEAGRGPLAGPVVAAATAWRNFKFQISNFKLNPNDKIFNDKKFIKNISLIKDSKLLTEKRREELYDFILENFYVGVGICDRKTIDRINILQATFLAMKKAIASLNNKFQMTNDESISKFKIQNTGKIVLVDGSKEIPNFSLEQQAIVNGDKIVKSISAASIAAKVTRDRIMRKMHKKYPQYNFAKHKGYGTREHINALKKYGPCEIHRKSFKPVSLSF